MKGEIQLFHGDGGKHTNNLIQEIFYKHFQNPILLNGLDSAILNIDKTKIAYTTDSFVVKPLFFRGGDIGTLAICGTINDLAVAGAEPRYLSSAFIIEEGFKIETLQKIAQSMQQICEQTKVKIVTGDTKVVEKGSIDGIFINTSGIGMIIDDYQHKSIEIGDEIIVTGNIGDHGTAIALSRYGLNTENIESDCAPLHSTVMALREYLPYIKIMKDLTRGGIATALNEIAEQQHIHIHLIENQIPISKEVQAVADLLGLEPLYLACEGRMILIVNNGYGQQVLAQLKRLKNAKNTAYIGRIASDSNPLVSMETKIGGNRILNMLEGKMFPRIC